MELERKRPSGDFWSGRRVLLTGHTGFKGAWMVLLLHRLGAEVQGFSLPEPVSSPDLFGEARLGELCEDVRGDVRDLAAVAEAVGRLQPSVVIHMAAQPILRLGFRDPVGTFATNVMGVVNVLEAVRSAASVEAVAVVTSDKCYENREQVWPYRENDAMGGHDPYSASKGCAEIAAAAYARTYFSGERGPRVASVRAGNVIGGGDWAADRLIPDLVRAAAAGREVEIRNPRAVRPWQHVLDPLSGYLLAMERIVQAERWSGFEAWNFGPNPGEEMPVRDVVEKFRAAWGGAPDVRYGSPREDEHEAGLLRVDSTKAKVELGWRPCVSNEGAIDAVVDWMREFSAAGDARTRCFADIERLLGL